LKVKWISLSRFVDFGGKCGGGSAAVKRIDLHEQDVVGPSASDEGDRAGNRPPEYVEQRR